MKTIRIRILAVDPGDKRLGIAISDDGNTLARPLTVIQHVSRPENAKTIISLAEAHQAMMILVGQSLDEDGEPTYSGRKANRLAAELKSHKSFPILLWDESFSTHDAKSHALAIGKQKKDRKGHQDDIAAAFILQSYLDSPK